VGRVRSGARVESDRSGGGVGLFVRRARVVCARIVRARTVRARRGGRRIAALRGRSDVTSESQQRDGGEGPERACVQHPSRYRRQL
ncbi:MAG: hypothetical protein M3Y87_14125, partial [Myxococcota bacterium]|nr:hypothetical protein [Myxococcota bacterium]